MQTKRNTTVISERLRVNRIASMNQLSWAPGHLCYMVLDENDSDHGRGWPILKARLLEPVTPEKTRFKVSYIANGAIFETIRATWKLYKTIPEAQEARDIIFSKRQFSLT